MKSSQLCKDDHENPSLWPKMAKRPLAGKGDKRFARRVDERARVCYSCAGINRKEAACAVGGVYLLLVALMFSFGGTCAKTIAPYYSPVYISFFRFFFGVCFLLLLKLVKRRRFASDFREALRRNGGWLLFGAASKTVAYWTENYALTHGVSYGNIITQPVQLLFLTWASVAVFKERITAQRAAFIAPCVLGVLLVSWNGRPLDDFLRGNLLLTGLFVVTGVCAGAHVLAQKKVEHSMEILDSNLTMFAVASVLSFLPTLPPTLSGAVAGVRPSPACIAAMLFFGFITGIGFYFNAKAIPLVPFYMVPILQSTMVLFSILWGVLFFHEAVSGYIVAGSLMFVAGIVGIQLADRKSA